MMRTEFEMLPGGWQVDAEEFEQVIDPCYMYLPEEAIGNDRGSFSVWLREHNIHTTEELRRTWLPIARDIERMHEQQQRQRQTIEDLRNRLKAEGNAKEALHRDNEALMKEKAELQDEVLALTKAVGEMGLYITDEQIVQMVNDAGRADFFIWCNGRVKE